MVRLWNTRTAVTSTSSSVSYIADGSTTYSIQFYFMAFSDLIVMLTTSGVTVTSPINSGWIGTGTNNSTGAYNNDVWSIIFQPGQVPIMNTTINVIRNTARIQPMTFQDYGPMSGPSMENALDRLTLIAQEGGVGGISSILGGGFLGYAAGIPTSGNDIQGQFYLNSSMQPGSDFGWMCTTTGAPGVWVSITTLSL